MQPEVENNTVTDQRELHLPAIPPSSVLIPGLRFDEVNGQKLNNPGRPVIMCSEGKGGWRFTDTSKPI
jgi:hypothetical protein